MLVFYYVYIFLKTFVVSIVWFRVNTSWDDTILDMSKLKALADGNLKMALRLEFVLDSGENIVEKGENAGYQHFFPFPTMFSKASFPDSLKPRTVW